ncbi:MAG: hypothetical protein E6713_09020 [Sporomusaceae bacterium]|nr:hypothetical protein [Sporomusaceae bacterium]
MKWKEPLIIFLITSIITILGNSIGYHVSLLDTAIGYGLLLAVTLVGIGVTHIMPVKLPLVFWISIVAILVSMPFSPIAPLIATYTAKVDFLALCTTILAYAGLSVGKDLPMFKKMSWRIIIVALAVYTGTFLFSTIIAQTLLKIEGII